MTEFWTTAAGLPERVARGAARAEEAGWDGLGIPDSQNIGPDVFVLLSIAAAATSRMKLQTFVTNPLTRHVAVTAAAAASIQSQSKGRFVLGVGRGDSSLAHLGSAPAPLPLFERFLGNARDLLQGNEIDSPPLAGARPVETLKLQGGAIHTKLEWLPPDLDAVPVEGVASGPRTLAIAGATSDRVLAAVGASRERLAWAYDLVADARKTAGLERSFGFGVVIPIFVSDDGDSARRFIRGDVASYARFSSMHNQDPGTATGHERTLAEVASKYDMHHHFEYGSPQSQALTQGTINEFSIAGDPDYCIDRLIELLDGPEDDYALDKVLLLTTGNGVDPTLARRSRLLLETRVVPEVRARLSTKSAPSPSA